MTSYGGRSGGAGKAGGGGLGRRDLGIGVTSEASCVRNWLG